MAIKRGGQAHLRNRVANVGNTNAQAMGAYHPAGTAATPMLMPLAHVQMTQASPQGYSVVAYQDVTPIWTTDGAAIPATAPGTWGQVVPAGRP